MIKDDSTFFGNSSNNQFVVSYELLALLHWLIEHEADKLKKIISKTYRAGLHNEIHKIDSISPTQPTNEIQSTIIEFFSLLEALLLESINEKAVQKVVEKNLMPTIDQIDSSVCDSAMVRFSIEKATSTMDLNPKEDPQDVLYKELLKRWKPSKKNDFN